MRHPRFLLLGLLLAAGAVSAPAAGKLYGKPLALRQETKVSEILANPAAFQGKTVRIRGTVVEGCDKLGCYVKVAGDQRFTSLLVVFEEGAVVMPPSLKGATVVAEGVVEAKKLSAEEQKRMCPILMRGLDRRFDPAQAQPRSFVTLRGIGVQAQ